MKSTNEDGRGPNEQGVPHRINTYIVRSEQPPGFRTFGSRDRKPHCTGSNCWGVSSDEVVLAQSEEIVQEEVALEEKEQYIRRYNADVLVMGDDWAGKFDWLSDLCAIAYLPRTPAISTTELIEKIQVEF